MPDYAASHATEVVEVREFMGTLVRSGIEPSQATYEGFKYALALLEVHVTMGNKEAMESAASLVEAAAKQAGIHSYQVEATRRKSSWT